MLDLTRVGARVVGGVQIPARVRDLGGRACSGERIGMAAGRSRQPIDGNQAHAHWLALAIVQNKPSMDRNASRLLVRQRFESDRPWRPRMRERRLEDRLPREEFLVNLHHRGEIMEGECRCEDSRDAAVVPRGRQREDDIAEVLAIAPKGVRHCVRAGDRKRAAKVE